MVSSKHLKVDTKLWKELHLMKIMFNKKSVNELLNEMVNEWKKEKGIKMNLEVKRG